MGAEATIVKLKAASPHTIGGFKRRKLFHVLIASLNSVCVYEHLVAPEDADNGLSESSTILSAVCLP